MIHYRWVLLIAVIQAICAMAVLDTPTGSDWIIGISLFGCSMLSIIGLSRLEGWD